MAKLLLQALRCSVIICQIVIYGEATMYQPILKENDGHAEKQTAYRSLLSRYNKAHKEQFYLESAWIAYAMIEDRTRAILYHCGIINGGTRPRLTTKHLVNAGEKAVPPKGNLRKTLNTTQIKVGILFDKCELLIGLISWAKSDSPPDNGYYTTLRKTIMEYDRLAELSDSLDALKSESGWRGIRNEMIHSLFDKNYSEVSEQLAAQSQNGLVIARNLDGFVKHIKRQDIRQRFKLGN
jgi:hypothetical protein